MHGPQWLFLNIPLFLSLGHVRHKKNSALWSMNNTSIRSLKIYYCAKIDYEQYKTVQNERRTLTFSLTGAIQYPVFINHKS
jgi:hypothetical protein